jgi:hypothetical protein
MKKSPNFGRLLDLRFWLADSLDGITNSLSSRPAKKIKSKKLKLKPKRKKKIKRTNIVIEDISDGNL